jgi:hypothetical protein
MQAKIGTKLPRAVNGLHHEATVSLLLEMMTVAMQASHHHD